MPIIGSAPSGENTSIDGTEKVPQSGNKFFKLSTYAAYLAALTQTLTNKTLTSPTVTTPTLTNWTGWDEQTETWTRTGNFTFTVATDRTAVYTKGTKVRYKDGGSYEYGVIVSSAFTTVTTVTLATNSDYAMAAATLTNTAISYALNPQGYPSEYNWAASITNLTQTSGTLTAKFKMTGTLVTGHVEFVFGASSSVGGTLTLALPVTIGTYGATTPIGIARFKDATGGNAFAGAIFSNGVLAVYNASATYLAGDPLSSTVPFTWATSDDLEVSFAYFA
jgi:hypothetical protein